MTNGDKLKQRIQNMSDKELAQYWNKNIRCHQVCPMYLECMSPKYGNKECVDLMEEWFKREAKEEEGK